MSTRRWIPKRVNRFEQVPPEIQEMIVMNLPVVDILNVLRTNKQWSPLINNDFFWRMLNERDFANEPIFVPEDPKEDYMIKYEDEYVKKENLSIFYDFLIPELVPEEVLYHTYIDTWMKVRCFLEKRYVWTKNIAFVEQRIDPQNGPIILVSFVIEGSYTVNEIHRLVRSDDYSYGFNSVVPQGGKEFTVEHRYMAHSVYTFKELNIAIRQSLNNCSDIVHIPYQE